MIEKSVESETKDWSQVDKEELEKAVEHIESLREFYYIHRHAVLKKNDVEGILTEGLKTQETVLEWFTDKVDPTPDEPNGKVITAIDLTSNRYLSRKYIAIIAIPKSLDYSYEHQGMRSAEAPYQFLKRNVLQPVSPEDEAKGYRHKIPSKFIVGYWDMSDRKWTDNPNFTSQHDA